MKNKMLLVGGGLWLLVLGMAQAAVEPTQESKQCIAPGTVNLVQSGTSTSLIDLPRQFAKRKVLLLGEHHDNQEHHRWQLQMITSLHAMNSNLVLGFEMFPRKMQPVLDRWVAGELSEEDFLKQSHWDEYWSFDADMYMPLFHYARMNRIPIQALNVDRKVIREIGKKGWQNLPLEQREGVTDPRPASRGYQEMLAMVFMKHGAGHGGDKPEQKVEAILNDEMFKGFVSGQQLWDRAMAQGIVSATKLGPGAQVVAVMGSGHMMNFYGVPEQLQDLGIMDAAVLIPWDDEFDCDAIGKEFADAVVGLGHAPERMDGSATNDKPKLGVYLEPGKDGVKIAKVVEKSIAATSGLQDKDLILEVAGHQAKEVGEVIETVKAVLPGTWLPIKVKRGKEVVEIIAKFPATMKKN
jgi:uncharacterized iron-regulated protein